VNLGNSNDNTFVLRDTLPFAGAALRLFLSLYGHDTVSWNIVVALFVLESELLRLAT
jgi:hypothetical protein